MELLFSHTTVSKILSFACSKIRYDTFQSANNKGADHDRTARMRRLVGACAVRKPPRQVFSRRGPNQLEAVSLV